MKPKLHAFVVAWQGSQSVQEVAEKTHTTSKSASVQACRLRKKGVKLKTFKRGGRRISVEELNKLIESLEQQLTFPALKEETTSQEKAHD